MSLGNLCLDTVEQLQKNSNAPQAYKQRSILQALDHVLFMTSSAKPAIYDRLCCLMKGTREAGDQGVASEMVDLVFRHCNRFPASDKMSESHLVHSSSHTGLTRHQTSRSYVPA